MVKCENSRFDSNVKLTTWIYWLTFSRKIYIHLAKPNSFFPELWKSHEQILLLCARNRHHLFDEFKMPTEFYELNFSN